MFRCFANGTQKKTVRYLSEGSSFLTVTSMTPYRTSQDPLVHHGRHFGRAAHAFCNVQTLHLNGLQAMSDDNPEESLIATYISYIFGHPLMNQVAANERSELFSESFFN